MLQPKKTNPNQKTKRKVSQNSAELNNFGQEALDMVQKFSKLGGGTLGKIPFGIGAGAGIVQSVAKGQRVNGSDVLGLSPNPYMQAASLTLMEMEKEKQNMEEFAKKKMQGKKVTDIKPKGKETNLTVKETISGPKMPDLKKKAAPVTSDASTKILRTALGLLMPDQAAQFLSAIATKDNKLGVNDLTPDIKQALFASVKNAKKRTGKASGGTQYADFGSDVDQAFQGMTAGPGKMLSIDPATQAAAMVGRVSYKTNEKGETEIYDSYDFSKTDPEKADTMYKKIRAYAGVSLPDEGNKPNLIGRIPSGQYAFGTNQDGIMKTRVTPRKKYANGTNTKGVGPNNYIQTPNDVLNDYNIMLAGVEKEVANNKLVPIVSAVGGLMQQAIGMAGSFAGQSGIKPGSKGALDKVLDVDPNKIMLQGAEGTVAANGNNSVQKDVEVEGGEMYETPQGQVGEFQGPSHEQGGIPLEVGQDVEEGTKVYSDRLKVGDKTLAERKEARERQIANLEKIASQPLVDSAVKNATKRRMMAIQKEESADLQFQEQVNNMQQMADTMVAAFGTSMAGLQSNPIGDTMEYGYGSGSEGVRKMFVGGTIGEPELDEFGNPIIKPLIDLKSMIMSPGIAGTTKPVIKKYATVPMKPEAPEYMKNLESTPIPTFANNFGEKLDLPRTDFGAKDFLNTFDTKAIETAEDAAFYTPGQVGTPKVNLPGTRFSRTMGKVGEKLADANEKGMIPGVGDLTKLFGNYLGMTAGIKTAAEQRSTDITHTNVYKNAGKESQKLLDNAKQGIETSKAQAMVKATDVGRGGKRGARNSARGVNQMRGMDWLYDTALQGQIAEISANAAQQISGIDVQKSGVAMNADQLRGKGEYDAAMANEAAKDAYYTALGKGRNQFAEGLMQSGKDLNAMKQNKMEWNMQKNSGIYVQGEDDGTFSSKDIVYTDENGKKISIPRAEFEKLLKQQKSKLT